MLCSRTASRLCLLLIAVAFAACTDQSPTKPLHPSRTSAQVSPDRAALEAQVNSLINALYQPKDQGKVFSAFARIKATIAAGQIDDAQSAIVAFFASVLADLKAGKLQDPNGTQPPSTADALRDLLNTVAQFGGLAPPIPPSNPFSGDGVVAVVGPDGGTVVTPRGFAGVRFPAGALPADVIVVIARLDNPTQLGLGPLPTSFDQYPLFYDFSTFPTVAHFSQPVTVALCRLEVGDAFGPPTQTVADRLQVAHPDPTNPSTIELLPRVDASFVHCDGVSLASAEAAPQGQSIAARMLAAFTTAGSRIGELFLPTPAYAVHGGLGGLTSSFSPFATVDPGRLRFASVSAGERHTCALTTGNEAWCWGDNSVGALGDGTTSNRLVPTQVVTTLRFTKISANNGFTCAIATDAQTYCWGTNTRGQLGDGTTQSRLTPVAVTGGHTFVDIGAGLQSACGRIPTGEVWCWGSNEQSQLGAVVGKTCTPNTQTVACSTQPVRAGGTMTFSSLAVGFWTVCGLSGGQALCWGVTGFGNPVGTPVPTPAPGNLTFAAVAIGSEYGCGLDASSHASCWGFNTIGELGNGTTTFSPSPVPVSGGLAFTSLALKNKNNILETTCGITATGDAYCWGSDANEELGAVGPDACNFGGLRPCALTPVHILGSEHYRQISIGSVHACGVSVNDAILCWGTGTSGQLGTGTTATQPIPTLTVHSF